VRPVALTLIIVLFAAVISGDEIREFDLNHPPAPNPGETYRLTIQPNKGTKPVTLLLVGSEDSPGIDTIIQPDGSELSVSTELATVDLQIDDYDVDGSLDFRIATNTGTGGTWYQYYRFKGKRFVEWNEPAQLGINFFDKKKGLAVASGRSGPTYHRDFYKLIRGHFVLVGREMYDKARDHRKVVPKEIGDDDYVLIKETIKNGKVTERTVKKI